MTPRRGMSGGAPPQLPARHSHRPATSAPQKHGGPVARRDWALVLPLDRWRPLLAEAGVTSGDGRGAVREGSMPSFRLLRAGLWLSRAMSRCVLEPRPPGKRWLVSIVEGTTSRLPDSTSSFAIVSRANSPKFLCLSFLI